jgi:hypothetical protein
VNPVKTIPRPLVRFQQANIVLILLFALLLRQPLLVAGLLVILAAGLLLGPKANLFALAGRALLARFLPGAAQEDADAQRFNQTLAVAMLGLSSLFLLILGNQFWGWLFAGLVAAAAGLALTGFCIGCVLYLRLRYLRNRIFGTRAA